MTGVTRVSVTRAIAPRMSVAATETRATMLCGFEGVKTKSEVGVNLRVNPLSDLKLTLKT